MNNNLQFVLMSERIFTLFGEEIVPEQPKPVGKSRAKKRSDDQKDEAPGQDPEDAATVEDIAGQQPAQESAGPEVTPEVPHTAAPVAETMAAPAEVTPAGPEAPAQAEEIPVAALPQEPLPVHKEEKETAAPAKKTAAKKKEDDKPKPENLPADWKGDKQYFTIGEVAELFKVKTSHIRFWTNEFKINVRTTRKGDRLYTPAQIREIRTIHHLVKERGFTLSGAKAKLKTANNIDVETVDLKKSLTDLRNKLVLIKNQLK